MFKYSTRVRIRTMEENSKIWVIFSGLWILILIKHNVVTTSGFVCAIFLDQRKVDEMLVYSRRITPRRKWSGNVSQRFDLFLRFDADLEDLGEKTQLATDLKTCLLVYWKFAGFEWKFPKNSRFGVFPKLQRFRQDVLLQQNITH